MHSTNTHTHRSTPVYGRQQNKQRKKEEKYENDDHLKAVESEEMWRKGTHASLTQKGEILPFKRIVFIGKWFLLSETVFEGHFRPLLCLNPVVSHVTQ